LCLFTGFPPFPAYTSPAHPTNIGQKTPPPFFILFFSGRLFLLVDPSLLDNLSVLTRFLFLFLSLTPFIRVFSFLSSVLFLLFPDPPLIDFLRHLLDIPDLEPGLAGNNSFFPAGHLPFSPHSHLHSFLGRICRSDPPP